MSTINAILNGLVKIVWHGVEVDISLDEKLPNIYDNSIDLGKGLGNLLSEISEHTNSNMRRVTTTLDGDIQRVELAWNGEPILQEELEAINKGYEEGAQLQEKPVTSGTRMAAYLLAQYGGKITIENFQDELYVARNVVELPVNYK